MAKIQEDSNTQEAILNAARKVFLREGMAGARMQDIADEAGINKALLHYYFRSKNQLFERIFQESAQRLLPRIGEILESGDSLFGKIEAFCSEYVTQIRENPFIPLFVITEVNRQPEAFLKKVFGKKRPNIALLSAQIAEAVQKKQIKPIHPMQLIMNMLSLCIFPFLARPVIQKVAGVNDKLFDELIEERKTAVAQFIIDSIRK
ncbi:MAG TPA: TetR/AcrR family transcriptional regulator [Chitinophagaceae bacterium]